MINYHQAVKCPLNSKLFNIYKGYILYFKTANPYYNFSFTILANHSVAVGEHAEVVNCPIHNFKSTFNYKAAKQSISECSGPSNGVNVQTMH